MAGTKTILDFSVFPVWKTVNEIRSKTKETLLSKGWEKDLIEAVSMCITELTENAIKYGTNIPGQKKMNVKMEMEKDFVIIRASNGIKDRQDLENVSEHIGKIKEVDNPEKLYINKLKELIHNPRQGVSKLGLYRIAYEGKLTLDYTYENDILTVTAMREISASKED